MNTKRKWITDVEPLIQKYHSTVLREIPLEKRQNVSTENIEWHNKNVLFIKAMYEKALSEITPIYTKMGFSILAIIPLTNFHELALSSGGFHEFHLLNLNKNNHVLIHRSKEETELKFSQLSVKHSNPLSVQTELKDYLMHTASYQKTFEPVIFSEKIHLFDSVIDECLKNNITYDLYVTNNGYHLTNFIPKEFHSTFGEDEDFIIGTLYEIKHVDKNNPEGRSIFFQVIFDQVPTVDQHNFIDRYKYFTSSEYLPIHHTLLGKDNFTPDW